MVHVSDWLGNSCLHANINKTMFFLRKPTETHQPDVFVEGEKLKVVSDFKYLGIILDYNLSFKKAYTVRPYLTTEAANLIMHAMIFSHIYCFTSWSQASMTTLYKQTLKTLDQKPNSYHHCHKSTIYLILKALNILQMLALSLMSYMGLHLPHWVSL